MSDMFKNGGKLEPAKCSEMDAVIMSVGGLGKQVPLKPKAVSWTPEGRVGNCPRCLDFITELSEKNLCKCGQRIDWGVE